MTSYDVTGAVWHKSTRSSGGNNCVEAATNLAGVVPVRDTKDRDGGTLTFGSEAWSAFVDGIKGGEFNLPA
jgi:hypothetical protein